MEKQIHLAAMLLAVCCLSGCMTALKFPLSDVRSGRGLVVHDLRSAVDSKFYQKCGITRPGDAQFLPTKFEFLAGELAGKVSEGANVEVHKFDIEIAWPFNCRLAYASSVAAVSYPAAVALGPNYEGGEGVICRLEISISGRKFVGSAFIPAFEEVSILHGPFPRAAPLGLKIQEAIRACVADAL